MLEMNKTLFEECIERMLRKQNVGLLLERALDSTPLAVNNRIMQRLCSRMQRVPMGMDVFAAMPVSEMTLLFEETFLKRLLRDSKSIETALITRLVVDLSHYDLKNLGSVLAQVHAFLARMCSLSEFSLRWRSNGRTTGVLTLFRNTLKVLIRNNPRLHTFSIIQVIEIANLGLGSVKVQPSDVESIFSILKWLDGDKIKRLKINHFVSGSCLGSLLGVICDHFKNLKYLDLHQVLSNNNLHQTDFNITKLSKLEKLTELDLSAYVVDTYTQQTWEHNLAKHLDNLLISWNHSKSRLKSLDFSGLPIHQMNYISTFLSTSPSLESFKICAVDSKEAESKLISDKTMHIRFIPHPDMTNSFESLDINMNRPMFVQKILYKCVPVGVVDKKILMPLLYKLTDVIRIHSLNNDIVSCALCSLGRINKKSGNFNMPISSLRQMIKSTMKCALESETHFARLDHFSQLLTNQDIIEHLSDTILVKLTNYFLSTLRKSTKNISPHDLTTIFRVAFLLLFRVNTLEAKRRFDTSTVKLFLDIITKKCDQNQVDETLEYAIKCIWNISDENPSFCSKLVENEGIYILIQTYNRFSKNKFIEKMVFAILNNVSEVSTLRMFLLQKYVVRTVLKHLEKHFSNNSFYACGIFSNVLIPWEKIPDSVVGFHPDPVKEIIVDFISKTTVTNMQKLAHYQSFDHFIELLNSDIYPCVLWSLWTIQNCILLHKGSYSHLVTSNKLLVRKLYNLTKNHNPDIRQYSCQIINFLSL